MIAQAWDYLPLPLKAVAAIVLLSLAAALVWLLFRGDV